jgi:hypothetical protein
MVDECRASRAFAIQQTRFWRHARASRFQPSGSFAFAAGRLRPCQGRPSRVRQSNRRSWLNPSGIPATSRRCLCTFLSIDQRMVNRDRAHPFTPSWSPCPSPVFLSRFDGANDRQCFGFRRARFRFRRRSRNCKVCLQRDIHLMQEATSEHPLPLDIERVDLVSREFCSGWLAQ